MELLKRNSILISLAFTLSQTLMAIVPGSSVPDSINTVHKKGICGSSAENDITASLLLDSERDGLIFMREEEKLAHDVYMALGEVWDIPIFSNISRSETSHMDAILSLLQKYQIADPAGGKKPGEYSNPVFAEMYNTLVKQGKNDLIDALRAGAFIEETDIADLRVRVKSSDNEDIKHVYNNLLQASYRHLRAFSNNLEFRNITYQPKCIKQNDFDEIIKSD